MPDWEDEAAQREFLRREYEEEAGQILSLSEGGGTPKSSGWSYLDGIDHG